jgi:uncharacterized protein (DUF927 family)
VAEVTSYPRVMLALQASFAAPLLDTIKAPNFCLDLSYESSTGKTTVLNLAASVWGCPDDRNNGSMITSWDATRTWLERAAATRSGLPILLDDTKRAQGPHGQTHAPGSVYVLTNGQGRGRGSVKGSQQTRYWRTVVISTGEARLVDLSRDGGLAARVVEVWGLPFGGQGPRYAQIIDRLGAAIARTYGHAGPVFVRWLLAHRDEWDRWREQVRELAAEMGKRATRGITSRIATNLAVLEIAGRVMHRALDLPWRYESPVHALLGELLGDDAAGNDATNRPLQALELAHGWAVANRHRFWAQDDGGAPVPAGRWLGR